MILIGSARLWLRGSERRRVAFSNVLFQRGMTFFIFGRAGRCLRIWTII